MNGEFYMKYSSLTCQQVCDVIDGKAHGVRVPMLLHFWVHPDEFGGRRQDVLDILAQYPNDIERVQLTAPGMFEGTGGNPEYRWMNIDDPYKDTSVGLDEKSAISDWAQLDEILI